MWHEVAARDAYIADATSDGFLVQHLSDDADHDGLPFGAQIHRVDSVQLEEIHAVVMTLLAFAEKRGGTYDGWETSVEKHADATA